LEIETDANRNHSIGSKHSKNRTEKRQNSPFTDQVGSVGKVINRNKRGMPTSSFSKSLDIPEVDSSLEIDKYEKSAILKESSQQQ